MVVLTDSHRKAIAEDARKELAKSTLERFMLYVGQESWQGLSADRLTVHRLFQNPHNLR
ncbi:hypothetical protein MKY91_17310 [Alkalicoccobacillus gibsonii]|uniref:Uncharacterized protein n=1 Tax=Alkalicoccobacillus gibsonii TaxID=79881 RepID=A0ABU9VLZ6_9BACI